MVESFRCAQGPKETWDDLELKFQLDCNEKRCPTLRTSDNSVSLETSSKPDLSGFGASKVEPSEKVFLSENDWIQVLPESSQQKKNERKVSVKSHSQNSYKISFEVFPLRSTFSPLSGNGVKSFCVTFSALFIFLLSLLVFSSGLHYGHRCLPIHISPDTLRAEKTLQ